MHSRFFFFARCARVFFSEKDGIFFLRRASRAVFGVFSIGKQSREKLENFSSPPHFFFRPQIFSSPVADLIKVHPALQWLFSTLIGVKSQVKSSQVKSTHPRAPHTYITRRRLACHGPVPAPQNQPKTPTITCTVDR